MAITIQVVLELCCCDYVGTEPKKGLDKLKTECLSIAWADMPNTVLAWTT